MILPFFLLFLFPLIFSSQSENFGPIGNPNVKHICVDNPNLPTCGPDFCKKNPDAAGCKKQYTRLFSAQSENFGPIENPNVKHICVDNPNLPTCGPDFCKKNPDAAGCKKSRKFARPNAFELRTLQKYCSENPFTRFCIENDFGKSSKVTGHSEKLFWSKIKNLKKHKKDVCDCPDDSFPPDFVKNRLPCVCPPDKSLPPDFGKALRLKKPRIDCRFNRKHPGCQKNIYLDKFIAWKIKFDCEVNPNGPFCPKTLKKGSSSSSSSSEESAEASTPSLTRATTTPSPSEETMTSESSKFPSSDAFRELLKRIFDALAGHRPPAPPSDEVSESPNPRSEDFLKDLLKRVLDLLKETPPPPSTSSEEVVTTTESTLSPSEEPPTTSEAPWYPSAEELRESMIRILAALRVHLPLSDPSSEEFLKDLMKRALEILKASRSSSSTSSTPSEVATTTESPNRNGPNFLNNLLKQLLDLIKASKSSDPSDPISENQQVYVEENHEEHQHEPPLATFYGRINEDDEEKLSYLNNWLWH